MEEKVPIRPSRDFERSQAMKANSYLIALFLLGLMFGHEAFAAEVESKPQDEVVTSTGERFQYCSADRCLSEGEKVIVLPSRCEYVRQSLFFQQKNCYSAEVVYVTEADLVRETSVAEKPEHVIRVPIVVVMLSMMLMVATMLLIRFEPRAESLSFIAFMATSAALLFTLTEPTSPVFAVLGGCIASVAATATADLTKLRSFYTFATIHLVSMTSYLYLA